jgi:hypothetical protein
MTQTFKPGQTVYDLAGGVAVYKSAAEKMHVVVRCVGWDGDALEPIYGGTEVWRDDLISASRPYVEDAKNERARLEALRKEICAEEERLAALRAEAHTLAQVCQQHEPIRMLLSWVQADDLWIVSDSPYGGISRASELPSDVAIQLAHLRIQRNARYIIKDERFCGGRSELATVCSSEAEALAIAATKAERDAESRHYTSAAAWIKRYPAAPHKMTTLEAVQKGLIAEADAAIAANEAQLTSARSSLEAIRPRRAELEAELDALRNRMEHRG